MSVKCWDFIVIGSGSTGAVVAARLSEDQNLRVLLLEAGPADRHWTLHMPAAFGYLFENPRFNWMLESEAQPGLCGRQIYVPRGKVLGGSSSINGMVFVRGHREDFDRWEREGTHGWTYSSVLPYFKRLESFEKGPDEYRGDVGPVRVIQANPSNALNLAFVESVAEAGYGFTPDYNGAIADGAFYYNMNIDRGSRASTAKAYIYNATRRSNMEVWTNARAVRVLLRKNRAAGVQVRRDSADRTVWANREVIVAAGAIHSPHLLLLSGIGPARQLESAGVRVITELPGVGENLQDHLEFHIHAEASHPVSLGPSLTALKRVAIGAQWGISGTGLGASNHCEVGAFIRSDSNVVHPDIQYHFWPLLVTGWKPVTSTHGFMIDVGTMRPKSRGHVHIRSADPFVSPRINPCYLADSADLEDLRAAYERTMHLLDQPALRAVTSRLINTPTVHTRTAIEKFIRENAVSAFHPCGTCRMGEDDSAVVDSFARVRGIAGLRVADASIMPSITSGNLNAPAMMIGEKIAELILTGQ